MPPVRGVASPVAGVGRGDGESGLAPSEPGVGDNDGPAPGAVSDGGVDGDSAAGLSPMLAVALRVPKVTAKDCCLPPRSTMNTILVPAGR